MLIDILIVVLAIASLYRGRQIGCVRQLLSTAGFFGGLFLGAWLEPHTVSLAHSETSRTVVTILTTLGLALAFLTLGEYLGWRLKRYVLLKRINSFDNFLGAGIGLLSLGFSLWLTSAVVATLPFTGLRTALQGSHILSSLNSQWPGAPTFIADLGHLIDPNGFPRVFIGAEPSPPTTNITLPSLGSLQTAVSRDQASVVKVEGQGCGGTVEGSGFVIASNLIATNAHVVAGIGSPYVQDGNGVHRADVIWFDPNLDFAVLRVSNLAGSSLNLLNNQVGAGSAAAVLGYPGGGPLTAGSAAVLDEFTATGRNIYDRGDTDRAVYEINATVIPGNSGGPLVSSDGTVIGVVFAESTAYQHVGYALTTPQIISEIHQAETRNQTVSTGQCAE